MTTTTSTDGTRTYRTNEEKRAFLALVDAEKAKSGRAIADICNDLGVSPSCYHSWNSGKGFQRGAGTRRRKGRRTVTNRTTTPRTKVNKNPVVTHETTVTGLAKLSADKVLVFVGTAEQVAKVLRGTG